jgi:hypothetical protein
MIFTRYLYLKDEVEISLTTSILEKKEEAVFWAYELYHSGYKNETFILLWKIYYYFFATLNPGFETYFMKKHKEWLSNESSPESCDHYVSVIVKNLMTRPFNLDVFLLHKINTHLELEEEEEENLENLLTKSKHLNISKYILTNNTTATVNTIMNHFPQSKKNDYTKIIKFLEGTVVDPSRTVDPSIILISRVMMFYTNKKGRSLYVTVEPEDVVMYETIITNKINYQPYKILSLGCIYPIDKYNYLSLFSISRNYQKNPLNIYHYSWLYYSSFTPVWSKRILECNGIINHELKTVSFENYEDEEKFYDNYGYEPDEQKIEVQHKNIQVIVQERTWLQLYNQHKPNGLIEIDDEIVDAFEQIKLFE